MIDEQPNGRHEAESRLDRQMNDEITKNLVGFQTTALEFIMSGDKGKCEGVDRFRYLCRASLTMTIQRASPPVSRTRDDIGGVENQYTTPADWAGTGKVAIR